MLLGPSRCVVSVSGWQAAGRQHNRVVSCRDPTKPRVKPSHQLTSEPETRGPTKGCSPLPCQVRPGQAKSRLVAIVRRRIDGATLEIDAACAPPPPSPLELPRSGG